MKNFCAILICLLSSVNIFAAGTCTIDSNSVGFFSPRSEGLPCVEKGVQYDQVLQIAVPPFINLQDLMPTLPIAYALYIDSLELDSIVGLPNGLSYTINPNTKKFYGGDRGCANIEGVTNGQTKRYNIKFFGRMTAHGMAFPGVFDGDTVIDLANLQANPLNPFKFYLDVINPGDSCPHAALVSGVEDFSAGLNAAFSVYPNPNMGVFQFNLNAGRRINGEISVVDITGRQVFSQKLDVIGLFNTTIDLSGFAKGMYSVQLKTAGATATKNISVQ